MAKEPYLAHSELTYEIYIVSGRNKYLVTDQAVKAVKAIQTLKQEPCTDAVSRAELLKAIDTWDKFGYTETGCFVREPKGDYVAYIHYDDVIKCIKGMPPVTQKSGKWIDHSYEEGYVECPFCGYATNCEGNIDELHYCFYCGARMESEE